MSLTLKIQLFNGQPYTEGKCIIINEMGGTIGRSDTCSLVLPDQDKVISRCHATVEYVNGDYVLIDNSLAGTIINDDVEPLVNAQVRLVDGMHIVIGDYQIAICIEDAVPEDLISTNTIVNSTHDAMTEIFASDPECIFSEDPVFNQSEDNALLNNAESSQSSLLLNEEQEQQKSGSLLKENTNKLLLDSAFPVDDKNPVVEANKLLNEGVDKGKPIESALLSEMDSSLKDSFVPAAPAAIAQVSDAGDDAIAEDFNVEDLFNQNESETDNEVKPSLLHQEAENAGATKSVKVKDADSANAETSRVALANEASSANVNSQLLQAFLNGAQINQNDIDPKNIDEKMSRIGVMFRQFVDNTVKVLRRRAEFKSLFRVTVTTIKKADNNPLKFAVTTDEALKHLINDDQNGFKKSVESIDEGFNDLLNHQLAMQAGIQAAVIEILRQFDPAVIEQQYKEGFVLKKNAKCWNKYVQTYKRLSETAVDDFYGDAFANAYEQQMKNIKK